MDEIREEVQPDGTRKIGKGPGYIYVMLDGTVLFFRENFKILPEKLTVAERSKGVKERLETNIADLDNLQALRDDIRVAPAVRNVVDRLMAILSDQSDKTALLLIKELATDLKAARRLRRANRKAIWPHDSFRVAVQHLYKTLGRPPLKHEVADLLEITKSHCSKLCKANGFFWLKNGRPQDALVHSVRQTRF